MSLYCDRCKEAKPTDRIVMFSIYHAALCEDCKNAWEQFIRTQPFWENAKDVDAVEMHIQHAKRGTYTLSDIRRWRENADALKMTAFPIIEEWVKHGR